jgi:hypothetical protein
MRLLREKTSRQFCQDCSTEEDLAKQIPHSDRLRRCIENAELLTDMKRRSSALSSLTLVSNAVLDAVGYGAAAIER